jgi:hypothetical protein
VGKEKEKGRLETARGEGERESEQNRLTASGLLPIHTTGVWR